MKKFKCKSPFSAFLLMYPEPITCFYETAWSPRDHIHLAFKVKLQQVIFSGCDVAWEGDSDERRETCTWYEYFSHKSCCCFSFPSSHPCFATVLPSTELLLKPAVVGCYPVFSSSTSERGPGSLEPFRHTGFI